MKFDLEGVILDLDGQPAKEQVGTEEKPELKDLTYKSVILKSLLGVTDQHTDGETKYKNFKLAEKINETKGEVELKSEEVTTVKQAVGKFFLAPLIIGRVYDRLEGKDDKGETE